MFRLVLILDLVWFCVLLTGEPVPVCVFPQQEHMDAVWSIVLVPVLQSDWTDLHPAFGYWIPDKE